MSESEQSIPWFHRKKVTSADIRTPSEGQGRTPWYSTSSKSKRCKQTFLIGVAGGTASGKTSVCRAIVNNLQLPWVQILSLDCFYRPLTKQERGDVDNYNFDHPNAFDWDLLLDVLCALKQGKAVKCPQYDFTTHSRKSESTLMYGADVVLCEGILILHHPQIVEQFDVKVFVKTDDDIRLIRRIKRDIAERGRTLENVISQYQKTVKPSYQLFCEPTQSKADIVIPRGRDNVVAIELLCDHIKNKLIEGGNVKPIFYSSNVNLKALNGTDVNGNTHQYNINGIPLNVMLPRDEDDDKVQHAVNGLHDDKLNGKQLLSTISLLCNEMLLLCIKEFMPRPFIPPSPEQSPSPEARRKLSELSVTDHGSQDDEDIMFYDSQEDEVMKEFLEETDTEINGHHQEHHENDSKGGNMDEMQPEICVVTIFSGGMLFGETIMEQMGNNKRLKVNYGSIHIFHESHKPSKPRFYDRKLPPNIAQQKVILVDAFIGTGNRARMALQVIIDHHVPEQNICFISLMSSKAGIINLAKVFPNVQFITASIDQIGKEQHWETVPVTSSLVIKYCNAAGIDIVEQDEQSPLNQTYSF